MSTHGGSTGRVRWGKRLFLLIMAALLTGALAPVATAGSDGPTAPSRRISYFFVGSLNPHPFWITPGPDGNLWFTDTSADAIGRITPTGAVTEFGI
ncbi:MAG TPA: hypothetical protein VF972_03260, partial [Actinomycetota bacterium]